MTPVTDAALLQQLDAPDVATPAPAPVVAPPASTLKPVTDPDLIAHLETPAPPDELRAYNPTWKDQIASGLKTGIDALGGDSKSAEWDNFVQGLVGSAGQGTTQTGLIDFTPARIPLNAQEAKRNFDAGRYGHAALDAVAAVPNPILGKAIDAGVNAGANAARAVSDAVRPGAVGPVAEAAERLGVDIPTVATYSDKPIPSGISNMAGKVASVPFIGTPIRQATNDALEDLSGAADSIQSRYLQQPRGPLPPAANASPAAVGDLAKEGISEWINGKGKFDSPAVLDRLYTKVDQQMNGAPLGQLTETRKAAQQLMTRDAESASSVADPALGMVADALSAPNGLTYSGMKNLRTNLGAMIDDGLLPAGGTTKPALKQLYGALSEDLSAHVAGWGGRTGSAAWDKAENVAKLVAQRREDLTKIIGNDGSAASENVIDRIVRFAGSTAAADSQKLALAKKTLGSDWDAVSASAVGRLGRDEGNEFNLGRFTKNYEALTQNGRNLLFAGTGKASLKEELDALSTIGTKFKTLQSYQNHSGTGGTMAVVGAGQAIVSGLAGIGMVMKTGLSGYGLAKWLARPARVKQLSQFSAALYNVVSGTAPAQIAKIAVVNMARHIANVTGQDPDDVQAKLQAGLMGKTTP